MLMLWTRIAGSIASIIVLPLIFLMITVVISLAATPHISVHYSTTPQATSTPSKVTTPSQPEKQTDQSTDQSQQDSSFWWGLLSNIIGAAFGAALAIPGGLWLDRRVKRKEQGERTSLILKSVHDELSENRR